MLFEIIGFSIYCKCKFNRKSSATYFLKKKSDKRASPAYDSSIKDGGTKMSSKTKIVVLHKKEIIPVGIVFVLAIILLLIILL